VHGASDNDMFYPLFRFITGNNRIRMKVPMTAPVISGEDIPMTTPVITAEKIPMTAPVITASRTMSFVMPEHFTRESIPEPLDSRITLEEVPGRTIAVIRFSGRADATAVQKMTDKLLSVLQEEKIPVKDTPFLMRYNSPWTPGFLRRNEVGVEIELV
ncbi:MAG: heme-binding protein, partial [Methanoregulaceae archaeon]|nr:heme-binding protein [Methanoregulaceae archaeon]